MDILNIAFESGYITITPSVGAPYRVPIADFLGGTISPTDLALLEGLVAASKGLVKVYEEEVDCSGGGTAETQALVTLPAASVILEIVTLCTEAFDGDTTKTFEVGIAANTDKYVDPVDCPITLNGIMSMAGGTNNDQQSAEAVAASTPLIATWTNTASMTAGKVKVRVVYF